MADLPLMQIDIGNALNLQGSSFLRYRDILLADVLTESYEVQVITSPDGSQDLQHHHVLKVTAIINPQVNSFEESPGGGGTAHRSPLAANRMIENASLLERHLLTSRGALDFYIGGVKVLSSPLQQNPLVPARLPCDSNEGPKPIYCHVTHITGTSSFFVRFGIETWIDACVQSTRPSYIHSHRFSMAHDVDGDTWLTTRHVTGHVKFRPEFLQKDGVFPDQIVRTYFHKELPGFKRGPVKTQALPNGMEVAYSFTDSEVTTPLGSLSPATKLTAEFGITSSIANNGKPANTMATIHVAAVGPKNQFRMNLLIMAMKIGLRKLQKPGLVSINDIVVTYSLDNTFVDLTMKAIWGIVAVGPAGIHLPMTGLLGVDDVGDIDAALADYRGIGEAPQGSQSDRALSPSLRDNGSMGTYAGFIVGSSIVNGCFTLQQPDNYIWDGKVNGKTLEDVAGGGAPITLTQLKNDGVPKSFSIQTVPQLTIANQPTGYSTLSTNNQVYYEEYKIDTRYHTNHGKAVMPVGYKQGSSPGDARQYLPPQVATVSLPWTRKSVSFSIAAVTTDPDLIQLPSPDTGDDDDVLLAEDISPATPAIVNSSSKAWRIEGTYWYLSKKLKTASISAKSMFDYTDQGIAAGKSVFDPSPRASNVIAITAFVAGYVPKASPG